MSPAHLSRHLRLALVALFAGICSGCAFKIVHPQPLVVKSTETGAQQTVHYPAYVLVHDEKSFWDGHQIKDNIVGLFEGEVVRWIEIPLDLVIPGPPRRPLQAGIESIKNSYAQLPDCAPVRIVDGLFSALEVDRMTVIASARIAVDPTNPLSFLLFTRIVYLTDWAQETLGEVNSGLGYLVPWKGPFIPHVVTDPINDGVDWTQSGVLTLYIYVVRGVDLWVDDGIYGGEWLWGKVVSLFIRRGEPVNQQP